MATPPPAQPVSRRRRHIAFGSSGRITGCISGEFISAHPVQNAATIRECLGSLSRLAYPTCEVIVVDDGSTDDTSAIAAKYGARLLRIERGGLSRARNEGIKAATGGIVAFIDADACADPHWLNFAIATLQEKTPPLWVDRI